jgi:hypothetical protein
MSKRLKDVLIFIGIIGRDIGHTGRERGPRAALAGAGRRNPYRGSLPWWLCGTRVRYEEIAFCTDIARAASRRETEKARAV